MEGGGAWGVLEMENRVVNLLFVLSLVVAKDLGFESINCVRVKWSVCANFSTNFYTKVSCLFRDKTEKFFGWTSPWMAGHLGGNFGWNLVQQGGDKMSLSFVSSLGQACQNWPCHLLHVVACMHHFLLFSFVDISPWFLEQKPTMPWLSQILFCFSFFQYPPLIQSCHLYSHPLNLPSHLSSP